jgi:hypothetical protein
MLESRLENRFLPQVASISVRTSTSRVHNQPLTTEATAASTPDIVSQGSTTRLHELARVESAPCERNGHGIFDSRNRVANDRETLFSSNAGQNCSRNENRPVYSTYVLVVPWWTSFNLLRATRTTTKQKSGGKRKSSIDTAMLGVRSKTLTPTSFTSLKVLPCYCRQSLNF